MISKPNTGKLNTEDDVYKYFGLNANEILFIKQFIKVSVESADTPKKTTGKKTKKHHSAGGRKTRKQKSGFMRFLNKYTRKT